MSAMYFAAGTGAAHAKGPQLAIGKKDCQRLVRHQARADVKYRPGIDVRGRKVAPADLHGGSPIKIPNVITFDVKFDIKNYLGKAEADAKAASAASIAADKAKSAATSASTAATSATAAATAAQTLATTALTAKTTADTALTTAIAASKADPGNNALDIAEDNARTAATAAAAEYTETKAEADAVSALATTATTAAATATDASSAASK
ncbi:MAG: hypothetical protein HOH80_22545, partial [Rhodospirillaceae bacterium]|nr:hypothetical protein [Rhodospirillaceae bacterium]